MTLPGINTELAGAVRSVNAAYERIPERWRPEPPAFGDLEREVERARDAGNRERALAAITAWRDQHTTHLAGILASCPLEPRR